MKGKFISFLDEWFGLRAWGLILYGALPATLALLGTLEVKLSVKEPLLPLLLCVSLLPLLITFLLVRSRMKAWYLTRKLLTLRSVIVTLLIVLCASMISGVSGIIHGNYTLSLTNVLDHNHMIAMAESFLMGICTLVITSTLFVTLLTKDTNLPGLPTTDYASSLDKVRLSLKKMLSSSIWTTNGDFDAQDLLTEARSIVDDMETLMDRAGVLSRRSLNSTQSGMRCFVTAVEEIGRCGNAESRRLTWLKHFHRPSDGRAIENLDQNDRESERAHLRLLRGLSLGK